MHVHTPTHNTLGYFQLIDDDVGFCDGPYGYRAYGVKKICWKKFNIICIHKLCKCRKDPKERIQ